jgi:Tfp pilus assembly protein PilN
MARVQFNLLPRNKLRSVEVERKRRMILSISVLVSLVSVIVFALVFLLVNVVQTKQLSDTNKQIDSLTSQLKKVPNLDKVLTVQNQLQTLVTLHQQKHITSRIFDYLPQVTPTNVFIGRLSLDTTNNVINLDGTAGSQHDVNIFIDTLKFTEYTVSGQSGHKNAFPQVTESSFSVGQGTVNYSLIVHFDPVLFANNLKDANGLPEAPKLIVPSLTTTRSVINDPANAIFNGQNAGEKTQ